MIRYSRRNPFSTYSTTGRRGELSRINLGRGDRVYGGLIHLCDSRSRLRLWLCIYEKDARRLRGHGAFGGGGGEADGKGLDQCVKLKNFVHSGFLGGFFWKWVEPTRLPLV